MSSVLVEALNNFPFFQLVSYFSVILIYSIIASKLVPYFSVILTYSSIFYNS